MLWSNRKVWGFYLGNGPCRGGSLLFWKYFVTRDGTDYGEYEIPGETKIPQVLIQLQSGKVVIMFDQDTETCNILRSDDPILKKLSMSVN